jgi:hypothetical protein
MAGHRLPGVEMTAARNEWQPIETAPKDGAALLLFERRGAMVRRYNLNSFNPAVGGEFFVGRLSKWGWVSMPGEYQRRPTHWHPLPKPPESGQ